MYAIADEETGRYLSFRSVPVDEKGAILYITYNGKLGADFFVDLTEAEILLNQLLNRINSYGVLKLLQVTMVNPDAMQLGEQIIEVLNTSSPFAVV